MTREEMAALIRKLIAERDGLAVENASLKTLLAGAKEYVHRAIYPRTLRARIDAALEPPKPTDATEETP